MGAGAGQVNVGSSKKPEWAVGEAGDTSKTPKVRCRLTLGLVEPCSAAFGLSA